MKAGKLLAAFAVLSLCHGAPAFAQMSHGSHDMAAHGKKVSVEQPWARASVGKNGATFLTMVNKGNSDDRLVAAKADVSNRVELHTHIMEGNIMRMRQVEAIPVPAGKTVMLKPGGLHVMMIGLNKKLEEGQSFPLTLVFEKAGEVTVTVPIMKLGAMGPGGAGSMGHGHDGSMGGMKH